MELMSISPFWYNVANTFHPQAAFSAINVEPEEILDEEVDTTKDLQVRCVFDFVVACWWCLRF